MTKPEMTTPDPINPHTLTSEERHAYHIEMWDWLARNPEREKDSWPGWDNFTEFARMLCFACEEAGDRWGEPESPEKCDYCPLEWPPDMNDSCEEGSLYFCWCDLGDHYKFYPEEEYVLAERAEIAAQIRDLPWKGKTK
jgi:hypothetical protein